MLEKELIAMGREFYAFLQDLTVKDMAISVAFVGIGLAMYCGLWLVF